MKRIKRNKKRILSFALSFIMMVSLFLGITPMEVSAASVLSYEIDRESITLYDSGCLKSITITVQANKYLAPAYGRIAIHNDYSEYDYYKPFIEGGQTSWPDESVFTSGEPSFITFANGDEFLWTDQQPHTLTVAFEDGKVDLSQTQTYHIYLWTRSASYGIYTDAHISTLQTKDGGLLDGDGNTLVETPSVTPANVTLNDTNLANGYAQAYVYTSGSGSAHTIIGGGETQPLGAPTDYIRVFVYADTGYEMSDGKVPTVTAANATVGEVVYSEGECFYWCEITDITADTEIIVNGEAVSTAQPINVTLNDTNLANGYAQAYVYTSGSGSAHTIIGGGETQPLGAPTDYIRVFVYADTGYEMSDGKVPTVTAENATVGEVVYSEGECFYWCEITDITADTEIIVNGEAVSTAQPINVTLNDTNLANGYAQAYVYTSGSGSAHTIIGGGETQPLGAPTDYIRVFVYADTGYEMSDGKVPTVTAENATVGEVVYSEGECFYWCEITDITADTEIIVNGEAVSTAQPINVTLNDTNLANGYAQAYVYTSGSGSAHTIIGGGETQPLGAPTDYIRVFVYADTGYEMSDGKVPTVTAANATVGEVVYSEGECFYWCEITDITADTEIIVNGEAVSTQQPEAELPVIVEHPQDATVLVGETATFKVTATGENLSYQWQINRNDGQGFVNINGATANTYTTSVVDMDCSGFQYQCIVINAVGSVVSNKATLHVVSNDVPHTHELEVVDAKVATCEEPGNITYYKCMADGCKDLFMDADGKIPTTLSEVILSALGHNMSGATCEDASKCQRAGCTYTEGNALGHDWSGAWKITKEATSTEEGKKETLCVRGCGHKKVTTIPIIGETDDNGNLVKDAEVEPDAPIDDATLDNPKAELLGTSQIFTDDEKRQIENGEDARVWIEISDTDENSLKSEDKAKIEQKLIETMGNDAGIAYFDVNMFKTVGGGSKQEIAEPGMAIKITITLASELLNHDATVRREYKILRLHEGDVEVINGKLNDKTGELSFETDKFSTYAIVYKDVPVDGGNNIPTPNEGEDKPEVDLKDEVPKTGESNETLYLFVIMIFSGLGVLIFSKRKEVRNKES